MNANPWPTKLNLPSNVQPLAFTAVERPSFRAEYAVVEGDLVFHFYRPTNPPRNPNRYWEDIFPGVLDPITRNFFKAEYPRLKAKRITDRDGDDIKLGIDSWWLRAYGFGYVFDSAAFAVRFLDSLEEALDKNKET